MNTINTFKLTTNKISNKKTSPNTESESLNRLLHLGETMIADKKFDIKQYLDTAENQFKLKRTKKPNLKGFNLSTDYLNYKLNKPKIFSSYTNDNFYNSSNTTINNNSKFRSESLNTTINRTNLVKENKMPYINLYSLSMDKTKNIYGNIIKNNYKINYLNTLSNYNKNKINEKYENMFEQNKNNQIKIINNEMDKNINEQENDSEEDNKLFKIEKVVKKIKKDINKNFNFKKYLENVKDIYDKKNVLIAIDSDILLNKHKKNKKKLKDIDVPISTFITQNKEISINNLLIKLINKESDKLIKKEQQLNQDLKKDISNIENEEKKFEEYSDYQKVACKKIEMTLTELQKKNKNLIAEEKKYRLEVKLKEYEIYKILVKMNLFRFYAKFANQVLDGDPTRFEKPIISDEIELDKINFEPIIKEVIDNYSSLKKYDSKKDNKLLKYYKEEGYFLYDPELIYHKFNEMEGNILRLLKSKEKLFLKIKKRQTKNNEALSYLIDRCKILQQEYDEKYEVYNEENQKYLNDLKNSGSTHINVNIHEKNNLIQELYMSVIDEFEPTITKLSKMNKKEFNLVNRKDLVHFDEIVEYGQNVLENIELNLNCFLIQMKNDEKEDKKIFDKVIYGIKTEYKLLRQSLFMKNKKLKQKELQNKIIEKSKKIKLLSKKSDPPFYKMKVNKKEEIDLNLIKKEEDKELMTYH